MVHELGNVSLMGNDLHFYRHGQDTILSSLWIYRSDQGCSLTSPGLLWRRIVQGVGPGTRATGVGIE